MRCQAGSGGLLAQSGEGEGYGSQDAKCPRTVTALDLRGEAAGFCSC